MEQIRRYGEPPFTGAVVHGGPGAPGSMAPVARELARDWGVLEPLQAALTLEGQVEELRAALEQAGTPPIVLIGSSWGAMLSLIVAARFPALVRKLILVGSGVYEARYAAEIEPTRLSRLSPEERAEFERLSAGLNDPATADRQQLLARFGAIFTRADAYDPLTLDTEVIEVQPEVFARVWAEASAFRAAGGFLRLAAQLQCPVVAIHGDYDPHPAAGVRDPLAAHVADFRFVLLPDCGHLPWIERQARDAFYELLRNELSTD